MTPAVQKRLGKIINFVYVAIILGLSYLFIKYCMGAVFPFIIAFFIAMIVQKPTNRCYKKIGKGKKIISTAFVMLVYLILAGLVSLLGAKIVTSISDFVSFLTEKINDFPTFVENIENWLLKVIAFLPDTLEHKLASSIADGTERFKELTAGEAASVLVKSASDSETFNIKSLISPVGGGVWNVVKEIPSIMIASLITVVSSCFMASDYDRLVGFLKSQLKPRSRVALSKSKHLLFSTLRGLIKAYGTIMFITFSEVAIGLYIMKFANIYTSGYIIPISIVTCIIDIIPVLGTGTVLIPWAIYSLITGKISLGIGLLVLYVIITVLRQFIEPKLVADKLGLPPVLTIAAMYIGTQLFGFIGLFLLPIILIMVKRLNDEGVLHLWNNKIESDAEVQAEVEAEDEAEEKAQAKSKEQ